MEATLRAPMTRRIAAFAAAVMMSFGVLATIAAPADAGEAAWAKAMNGGTCFTTGSSSSSRVASSWYSGPCTYGYGVIGYTNSTRKCSNSGQHGAICTSSRMTRAEHGTPAGSGTTYV